MWDFFDFVHEPSLFSMGGNVVVLDTKFVRVNGLKSFLDLSQGPLGFLFEELSDVGVENLSVGKCEGHIKVFILDNLVLNEGGFKPVFGIDFTKLSKVFQSWSYYKKYGGGQVQQFNGH